MIPKFIHYCWFGKKPMPPDAERYIDGWRKLNPDYEIIRWDENNFMVNLCHYTLEAYNMKEWAFVSDVCRMYALYNYGGIYLDTDVELLKPLDSLLDNESFAGDEGGYMGTAVIGATPRCEWVRMFLFNYYMNNCHFINIWGHPVRTPNPTLYARYIKPHLSPEKQPRIYPQDYFYPPILSNGKAEISPDSIAIHHFSATWRKKRTIIKRLRILYEGFWNRWIYPLGKDYYPDLNL